MKTRRKAKQLNQTAESADGNIDSSISQSPEAHPHANALYLEAPDDFNVDDLERLLPGLSLMVPTAETIIAVYRFALDGAIQLDLVTQDRDQARADVTRLEVELDQALQDQDVQSEQLRTSLDEAHKELEKLKTERVEFGRTPLNFTMFSHLVCIHSGHAHESGRTNCCLDHRPYLIFH